MRAFYRVLPGTFSSSSLLRTEKFLGPAVDNWRTFAVFKPGQCAFEFRLTCKPVLTLSAVPKTWSKENEMMFASPSRLNLSIRLSAILIATLVCGALASGVAYAQSQANAADLQGFVRDTSGAVVVGAKVTARNTATNFTRDVVTNDEGFYQITSLPPGNYEVLVEAAGIFEGTHCRSSANGRPARRSGYSATVGEVGATVEISAAEVSLIESSSTTVSNTIDQTRINDLPINERSATGFALTISTVGRDNGRPIGPAPYIRLEHRRPARSFHSRSGRRC